MASRAVACIRAIKDIFPTVPEIPPASRKVSEVISVEAGAPGIFIEVGAAAVFSGQDMRGAGPSQADLTIPFGVVILMTDLPADEPATACVVIAEGIRLEFERRLIAGEFRGLGAIYLDAWAVDVLDEWPIVSGSFRVQGFF